MDIKKIEDIRGTISRGIERKKPDASERGLTTPDRRQEVASSTTPKKPNKKLTDPPKLKGGLKYLGDENTKPNIYVRKTKEYPRLVLIRSGGQAFVQYKGHTIGIRPKDVKPNYTYFIDNEKKQQYYFNTEKGRKTASPVHGYRSKLIVEIDANNKKYFDAIERADGFRHLKPTKTKEIYVVVMRPRAKHPHAHELAVTGTNVFFHNAKFPSDLDGCIAPGKAPNENEGGILESQAALNEIIDLLGGWENKKEKPCRLIVRGFKETSG